MANGTCAHLDVLRDPRAAVAAAVDHLRAGAADAAGAGAVLAACREQALRGAEEARGPRAGHGDGERVGRRPRTVYAITPAGRKALHDVDAGSPSEGPVVEFEGLDARCSSRSTGRRPTSWQPSIRPTRGWSAATRRARASRVATSTGRAAFPERLPWLVLCGSVPAGDDGRRRAVGGVGHRHGRGVARRPAVSRARPRRPSTAMADAVRDRRRPRGPLGVSPGPPSWSRAGQAARYGQSMGNQGVERRARRRAHRRCRHLRDRRRGAPAAAATGHELPAARCARQLRGHVVDAPLSGRALRQRPLHVRLRLQAVARSADRQRRGDPHVPR